MSDDRLARLVHRAAAELRVAAVGFDREAAVTRDDYIPGELDHEPPTTRCEYCFNLRCDVEKIGDLLLESADGEWLCEICLVAWSQTVYHKPEDVMTLLVAIALKWYEDVNEVKHHAATVTLLQALKTATERALLTAQRRVR